MSVIVCGDRGGERGGAGAARAVVRVGAAGAGGVRGGARRARAVRGARPPAARARLAARDRRATARRPNAQATTISDQNTFFINN